MWSVARAILALGLAGCGSPTELVVVVYCDLAPSTIDRVEIRATGSMTTRGDMQSVGGLEDPPFPLVHALVPASDAVRDVTVEVVGLRGATEVVSQRVRTSFVPGEQRLVRLELLEACRRVEPCPSAETCVAGGSCRTDLTPGGSLPPWTGAPPAGPTHGGMDAGLDAGPPRDAGRDAARGEDAQVACACDAGLLCLAGACVSPIEGYVVEPLSDGVELDACESPQQMTASGSDAFPLRVPVPFPFRLLDVAVSPGTSLDYLMYARGAVLVGSDGALGTQGSCDETPPNGSAFFPFFADNACRRGGGALCAKTLPTYRGSDGADHEALAFTWRGITFTDEATCVGQENLTYTAIFVADTHDIDLRFGPMLRNASSTPCHLGICTGTWLAGADGASYAPPGMQCRTFLDEVDGGTAGDVAPRALRFRATP